jgi:hypothetical protein
MENVMTQVNLEQEVSAIVRTLDPKELLVWIAEINGYLVETANYLNKSDRVNCAMFLYRLSTYFMPYFVHSAEKELVHELLNVYLPDNVYGTKKALSDIGVVYFHQHGIFTEGYEPVKFLNVFNKLMVIQAVCSEYEESIRQEAAA